MIVSMQRSKFVDIVHIHAAQLVNDRHKAGKVDPDIVVDLDPEQLLQRPFRRFNAMQPRMR